jgi:GNAT superfamily N-acetyltransferase
MLASADIRDAQPGEGPALEALQRRASDVWEQYRAALAAHPDAIALPPDAVAEGRVRVAVDPAGRRLGFSVVLAPSDGTVELDGLFVEPGVQHAGIGRRLVEEVVARADADPDIERISVIAGPAEAFYVKLGFQTVGTAETRFGPAVRMERDL